MERLHAPECPCSCHDGFMIGHVSPCCPAAINMGDYAVDKHGKFAAGKAPSPSRSRKVFR